MRKMYPGTGRIPCLPLLPVVPWVAPTCLQVTARLQMKGFIHLAEPFCKIDRGKLTLDYYFKRLISCVRYIHAWRVRITRKYYSHLSMRWGGKWWLFKADMHLCKQVLSAFLRPEKNVQKKFCRHSYSAPNVDSSFLFILEIFHSDFTWKQLWWI